MARLSAEGMVVHAGPVNYVETAFCIEVVEEALARYGKSKIFNADQGSQFTSLDFTAALKKAEITVSMDGWDAWHDNVFIE